MCTECCFFRASHNRCQYRKYLSGWLSYGSGEIVKKVTGKTTTENIKSILKSEKVQAVENENYEEFVNTAKNLIYVNSEIKDLANQ